MTRPVATYRLQMHAGFNLADARAVVPYLHDLGISHLYLSSLLTAKPGSTHGYDVIDHGRLNPELGTEDDLKRLAGDLKARGMGILLDVVPNHMSVGGANLWWRDVLENGPSSSYAGYFDIAWNDHYRAALRGKVLLPILGTSYGEAVDGGQFRAEFAGGAFWLRFAEMSLPIDPRTYGLVLEPLLEANKATEASPATLELQSILTAIRHLPARDEADAARIAEGRNEIKVVKRRLAEWSASDPDGHGKLVGQLAGHDAAALDRLIEAQAYRPCYWRVASDEINYRRFFDVNDLAALCTEREEVFNDVHRLIFRWLDEGVAEGLRIDHPDGLYHPREYLERLRARWRLGVEKPPLYVVVEKILGAGESLSADWFADGTTGYEFLNAVNGLFVDPAGEAALTRAFEDFTGWEEPFHETVYRKKFLILQSSLTSELHVLAGHFDRLARGDRASRDLTLNGLRHALRELLCCFPIYRTDIHGAVRETDAIAVKRAVRQARRRHPLLGRAVFDFLRDTLLLKDPPSGPPDAEYRTLRERCVGRFQQLCAPVMAKGLEDTALYLFNRLTSLNEVGGDPSRFGQSPAELHAFLEQRRDGLSPLATHDTKRGEDVRARLNVLSELPREWAEAATRWRLLNAPHRVRLADEATTPDPNEEYLLYQTLVGTWTGGAPEYAARIVEYMTKAVQEAKVHSSWINPDADHLNGIKQFIEAILDPARSAEFLADLDRFVARIAPHGILNSLAQTLLRCTAPGVPDTYQGTEFPEFLLVDPDNRRPVDYDARRQAALHPMDEDWYTGLGNAALKLRLIRTVLRLRRDHVCLRNGAYEALPVNGQRSGHLFAFLRQVLNEACLVAAPRLSVSLYGDNGIRPAAEVWGDTRLDLPPTMHNRKWRDALGRRPARRFGDHVPARELFSTSPVTLWLTT